MLSREWRDQVQRDLFVSDRTSFVLGRLFGFVPAILLTAALLYELTR